jgi:hypothetical protein
MRTICKWKGKAHKIKYFSFLSIFEAAPRSARGPDESVTNSLAREAGETADPPARVALIQIPKLIFDEHGRRQVVGRLLYIVETCCEEGLHHRWNAYAESPEWFCNFYRKFRWFRQFHERISSMDPLRVKIGSPVLSWFRRPGMNSIGLRKRREEILKTYSSLTCSQFLRHAVNVDSLAGRIGQPGTRWEGDTLQLIAPAHSYNEDLIGRVKASLAKMEEVYERDLENGTNVSVVTQ